MARSGGIPGSTDSDVNIYNALRILEEDTGKVFSVAAKAKNLLKFGRRSLASSTVRYTVDQAGTGSEVYQTTNTIDTVVSTDAADTVQVLIEGHTVDGSGDFTFVTQTATLAGTTPVTLDTPLARATRAKNADTGTPPANGTQIVGDVRVYRSSVGVPTANTDAQVHLVIEGTAGRDQSFKGSTTISSVDAFILTQVNGAVFRAQAANVDFLLEVRDKSGVFRQQLPFSCSTTGGPDTDIIVIPHIVVPPNSDIRVTAQSSANNTTVAAFFNGYLAIDTSAL